MLEVSCSILGQEVVSCEIGVYFVSSSRQVLDVCISHWIFDACMSSSWKVFVTEEIGPAMRIACVLFSER
jgi:hypothetical protein